MFPIVKEYVILSNTFATSFASMAMLSMAQQTGKFPQIVRLVVGVSAGESSDTVTQLLANELQNELKTPPLPRTRWGAGGRASMTAYRNGPKDGSVALIAPNSLSVLQSIVWEGKLDYDLKTNPTKASYSTAVVGGHPHLTGMMCSISVGINRQVIPYKGGAH
jgi:tripartite-type tricarboxylate transporter receptor subunit TctC